MALNLYDAVTEDGIFNILGKAFYAASVLNTSRQTTVPAEFQDLFTEYKKIASPPLSTDAGFSAVVQGLQSYQSGSGVALTNMQQWLNTFIIEAVNADSPQPLRTIELALEYLIAQMVAQSMYLDGNGASPSLTPGAGNSTTDLAIAYVGSDGKRKTLENAIPEDLTITIQSTNRETAASILVTSPASVGKLDADWPAGSGTSTSFTATDPAESLLTNGDFEDESTTVANLPEGWIIGVGTPGTHFSMTAPEQQTIAIAGGPGSGQYWLKWANAESLVRQTFPIQWNATASDIQAALNLIPGLENVTVALTSGAAPNYTYTVTFTGTNGNVNALTVLNQLNTGTVTIATTVGGSANAYKGRSLVFIGDGATLTSLYLPLPTLDAETVYFIQWRQRKTGTPAAGVVWVSVKDSIGGSPITNNGGSMLLDYDLTSGPGVSTTFGSEFMALTIRKDQPQPLYLCFSQNIAISAGTSWAVDEVSLELGTETYPGGPFVGAQGGKLGPYSTDQWVLNIDNPQHGTIRTWMDRFIDISRLGLHFPLTGSTNIPDSLVG